MIHRARWYLLSSVIGRVLLAGRLNFRTNGYRNEHIGTPCTEVNMVWQTDVRNGRLRANTHVHSHICLSRFRPFLLSPPPSLPSAHRGERIVVLSLFLFPFPLLPFSYALVPLLFLSLFFYFSPPLFFSSPIFYFLLLSLPFFSFLSLFFFEAVTLIAEAFGRYSFEVFLGRVPRNPFDTPFPTPRRMLPLPFDPRMEFFHHPPVCHPILIRRNFIKFPSIDVWKVGSD